MITQQQAAEELECTTRQVLRMLKRLQEEGDKSVIHGLTGQPSNHRIEETVSVSALCAELVLEFDVDPATCESDVLEFLNDLQAKGLVQAVEA